MSRFRRNQCVGLRVVVYKRHSIDYIHFSDNYVCVFGVGAVRTIPHPPRIFRRLALLLVHLRL
jgi:hypothetical protein